MSHCETCGKLKRKICRHCQPQEYIDMLHKALEGVIDVQPIGYHSLQLIFRSQTDIAKFKAAHGIKGAA